jgi:riboflavin synthase
MFTGIVDELATVRRLTRSAEAAQIAVEDAEVLESTGIGDSIAVNGVCLTVTALQGRELTFDVMEETLLRTTLGKLKSGSRVNLERAVRMGEPLGGHLVQGHVDGKGQIRSVRPGHGGKLMEVAVAQPLLVYVVPKGSVALDGVSLTAAAVERETLTVGLVPHTLEATTLGHRRAGDEVNVEVDILGKYIRNFLQKGLEEQETEGEAFSQQLLEKYGF